MYTEIEVVKNRFSGARLNLKRADGQCLTLDFENEVCIVGANGKIRDQFGFIRDAGEFLRIALEFTSAAPVTLKSGHTVKSEVAASVPA